MRKRITLRQIAQRFDYILNNATTGFATLEERAMIEKANEEREALVKLVAEQMKPPWFETGEYLNSGFIKRLWLSFKYAFEGRRELEE